MPPPQSDPGPKNVLRGAMRALLARIASADRADLSRAACAHLLALPEFTQIAGGAVLTTLSLPDEIDTAPLIEALLAAGRVVAVPVLPTASPSSLLPVRLSSLSPASLTRGPFGVREPLAHAPVAPADISIIVLPGLAFDSQGARLGRGAGFFDRFLAHPDLRALLIGLCFDEQVAAHVPREPHDRDVHLVVTPRRVIRAGYGSAATS